MSPKWLHFGTLVTIRDDTNNVTILLVGAETITNCYSGWQYQSCFHAPKSQDWLISKALGENTPRSIENRSEQEVTSVSPTSKLKDQLVRSSPIFLRWFVPWSPDHDSTHDYIDNVQLLSPTIPPVVCVKSSHPDWGWPLVWLLSTC